MSLASTFQYSAPLSGRFSQGHRSRDFERPLLVKLETKHTSCIKRLLVSMLLDIFFFINLRVKVGHQKLFLYFLKQHVLK